MKYNLSWLLQKTESEENLRFLYFWGHRRKKDGSLSESCLSQWWLNDFEYEGIIYKSAEHWMMAEKARVFKDKESEQAIIKSNSPELAKKLGRKVQNYDDHLWRQDRYQVVVKGNMLKFSQNAHLKRFLVNTGNRILVEASPYDKIWGIGLAVGNDAIKNPEQWQGTNLLGFALMEVRDQLQKAP